MAAHAAKRGLEVASKVMGAEHALTITLKKSLHNVTQKSKRVPGLTKDESDHWKPLPAPAPPRDIGGPDTQSIREKMQVISDMKVEMRAAAERGEYADAARIQGEVKALEAALPLEESFHELSISVLKGAMSATESRKSRPLTPRGNDTPRGGRTGSRIQDALEYSHYPTPPPTAPPQRAAPPPPPTAYPVGAVSTPRTPGSAKMLGKSVTSRGHPGARDTHLDPIDFERAFEKHPRGPGRTVGKQLTDCRPNRTLTGVTRAGLTLRQQAPTAFQESNYRDLVIAKSRKPEVKRSKYLERIAVERIQRCWRAHFAYREKYRAWIATTRVCAVKIQSAWRGYHARRLKYDRAANCIIRHWRGILVRNSVRRHNAAVCIQRHFAGWSCRKELRRVETSCLRMQCLVRGGLGRRKARHKRAVLTRTAITLQRGFRAYLERQRQRAEKAKARDQELRWRAAVYCQLYFKRTRAQAEVIRRRKEVEEERRRNHAAIRIQSQARARMAQKNSGQKREERTLQMHQAATAIRSLWIGLQQRRRFAAWKAQLAENPAAVIVLQRYGRGFVVRLRLWKQDIKNAELRWAAIEIQRVVRGRAGRKAWCRRLVEVWSRHVAAQILQRNLRGFVARRKVQRHRHSVAWHEFQQARARYMAAQKIQAVLRGVQARTRVAANRRRAREAASKIQRAYKGHAMRQAIWNEVVFRTAAKIQALVRGYLVRCRHGFLTANVRIIQRQYRHFRRNEKIRQENARRLREERKRAATVIQARVRERQSVLRPALSRDQVAAHSCLLAAYVRRSV